MELKYQTKGNPAMQSTGKANDVTNIKFVTSSGLRVSIEENKSGDPIVSVYGDNGLIKLYHANNNIFTISESE